MRKTAVLAAATVALTVGPAAAASAAVMLPPTPSFAYISTSPYVDPNALLIELDTSEGLRAALHINRTTVVDLALGNYVNPMTGVRGPYLRLLDCRYAADIACRINRAGFVGTITSVKLPAAPGAASTTTVTKTVTKLTTMPGTVSRVTTTVTTIKQSVPAVKAPVIKLPVITVPVVQVPVIVVPAVPAPAPQGLVSGLLGAVGDTVNAVLGTTPVPAPPAPAPTGLLGALLG